MAVPVLMPRQGQSVETCLISRWHKKVGETVNEGDLLFTYETDKATFEESASASGVLLAIFFGEDSEVPVLTNVAVIGTLGEDYSGFIPGSEVKTEGSPAKAAEPKIAVIDIPVQEMQQGIAISPRARATAKTLGVEPSSARPTGPNGRIIERDVEALAAAGMRATQAALFDKSLNSGLSAQQGTGLGGRISTSDLITIEHGALAARENAEISAKASCLPSAVEYEDVKLSNLRKVIARNMQYSLSNLAQLTHHSTFDATALLNTRKEFKRAPEHLVLPNITLNDMLLFACSRILLHHPDINAHFLEDTVRRFKSCNVGFAVDTPRGLLVPTIVSAQRKSLSEIAAETKLLSGACQQGSINPDLLSGATFTVSNLGALGVEGFTPVITPPQTAILGVGSIIERVRTVDGAIKVYPAMMLSLTYDHRAVDGAPAARFILELTSALENFTGLLAG